MIICVHGNIGAGKTTYINNQSEYIKVTEPLQDWDLYFTKYY